MPATRLIVMMGFSSVVLRHTDVIAALRKRFAELQETVFWSGGDASFDGTTFCNEVDAQHGFAAPYRTHPEQPPH